MKRKLRHLPERLILCIARRFVVGPIRLFVFLQSRDRAEELRTKTATALSLIETHAPKYFSRVRRFIPRILIFGGHGYTAVYISELGLCDIARDYALAKTTTPFCLAMTLVHEATHGYLESRGFAYEEHRREQIETICMRTEVAFARRLPESAELVAEAEGRLHMPSVYWKTEAFVQRDIEHLKKLRAPRWLVRFVEWRLGRLAQRDRTANGSQSPGSDTNSTSTADGSRRSP
jgi:hypothetical protein